MYGKSKLSHPQVARLEVIVPKEAAPKLREAMQCSQRIANLAVKMWLRWHEDAGTLALIDEKKPCAAFPPDLTAAIRARAFALFPTLTYATVNALVNWLDRTISTQNSPKSNVKRWKQVLRHAESHWSYEWPLPLRLWSGNAKAGMDEHGPWLQIAVERVAELGKARGKSVPVVIRFNRPHNGGDDADYRAMYAAFCEVARGDRPLAQSNLSYDRRKDKWFLALTVEGPEKITAQVVRDPKLIIFVRPGRYTALRIHANTRSGGFGVEQLDRISRERIKIDARWKSLKKDFGDHVPANIIEQQRIRWRGVTSSIGSLLVAKLAASLRQEPFGKVVWLDGNNRTCGLATAGKQSAGDFRELFTFESMRRLAEKKLAEMGMEFVGRANYRSVKRRKSVRERAGDVVTVRGRSQTLRGKELQKN